jgi:hypothetical protein
MINGWVRGIVLAAALATSGCVTTMPQDGPATVAAGEGFSWYFYSTDKRWCDTGMPSLIKIITPPRHGRAEVIMEHVTVDDEDKKCNGRTFKANKIVYEAPRGYKGPDDFVIEVGSQRYVGSSIRAWKRYEYKVIVK